MSLAPASSRGFFLNARLAVNGIQCAARSFGTLTAGRGGLLSSIGCLFGFGLRDLRGTLSASRLCGNGQPPTFEADQSGGLMVAAPSWPDLIRPSISCKSV